MTDISNAVRVGDLITALEDLPADTVLTNNGHLVTGVEDAESAKGWRVEGTAAPVALLFTTFSSDFQITDRPLKLEVSITPEQAQAAVAALGRLALGDQAREAREALRVALEEATA